MLAVRTQPPATAARSAVAGDYRSFAAIGKPIQPRVELGRIEPDQAADPEGRDADAGSPPTSSEGGLGDA